MSAHTMADIQHIAQQFAIDSQVLIARPHGNGLINNTYYIETNTQQAFILQRLNPDVFGDPEAILQNIARFYQSLPAPATAELQFPAIIATQSGAPYLQLAHNEFWRMMGFINDSCSFDSLAETQQPSAMASQIGQALARFHALGRQVDIDQFQDTLPGFHIAPGYLAAYDAVSKAHLAQYQSEQDRFCQAMIARYRDHYTTLENAKARAELKQSLIHGDPKLNNFLFNQKTQRLVSLIDLDTLKPGLIHYDIGDALRSLCNLQGESPDKPDSVQFDLTLAGEFLRSYLAQASTFLQQADTDHLYTAILLLPLELGTRFYTDYLNGNRYFKVSSPEQNRQRATTQFSLAQDIANKQTDILAMINASLCN